MRFLVFSVLVLCLAVGAAWYFEWITFTVARTPEGSVSDVNVKINRDRIKEDIDRGSEEVKAAADAVKKGLKKNAKEETVRGVIRDATTNRVSLDVAGKTITVMVTADTKINLDGRIGSRTDLRTGQDVRCSYVEQGGEHVGREITVLAATK
ncbi:MAG: hypothetical protein U0793_25460 [Gemmataceae bacterium]